MRRLVIAIGMALTLVAPASADIITQWNFNSETPDGSTATGTSAPSIDINGGATISTIGGVNNPGFNSGVGSSDPAASDNSGFQTDAYPAQGTNSGTAGIQVRASTVGRQNVSVSFDLRTSNTSSRWYQVRYTIDGSNYIDFGTAARLGVGDSSVGDTWTNTITADFSAINANVNDNANFGFQVVSVFSPEAFTEFLSGTNFDANTAYEASRNRSTGSQSNYAGGTWRFDMVTVNGVSAVPEPTSLALVGCVIAGAAGFRFRRSAAK